MVLCVITRYMRRVNEMKELLKEQRKVERAQKEAAELEAMKNNES